MERTLAIQVCLAASCSPMAAWESTSDGGPPEKRARFAEDPVSDTTGSENFQSGTHSSSSSSTSSSSSAPSAGSVAAAAAGIDLGDIANVAATVLGRNAGARDSHEGEAPLDEWETRANDVMWLKLARSKPTEGLGLSDKMSRGEGAEPGDRDGWHHPIFTHQVFGEEEKISGYKGLSISILYNAHTMDSVLDVEWEAKCDPRTFAGRIDDPRALVRHWMEEAKAPPADTFEAFAATFDSTIDLSFGDLVHEYESAGSSFEVRRTFLAKDAAARAFHRKCQLWLIWNIDGSNFIDERDEQWEVYFLFERDSSDPHKKYIVGFLTVYNYFAYPDLVRKRISQICILPAFQRHGHGRQLLLALHNLCDRESERVADVTVEDPTLDFTCLRDSVDLGRIRQNVAVSAIFAVHLKRGAESLDEDALKTVREQLHISGRQAQHLYEIELFRTAQEAISARTSSATAGEQVPDFERPFRLRMKKRLFNKYQDLLANYEKHEDRLVLLAELYKEMAEAYQRALSGVRP